MRPLLTLLVFLISLGNVVGQNQSQSDQSNRKPKQNQTNPVEPTKPLEVHAGGNVEAQAADSKQQTAKQEPRPWMTHAEWVMSVLTFIYVVIAFFGLRAIKSQGDIMLRQMQIMKESQDLEFRQWVEFKDWRTRVRHVSESEKFLDVEMNIVNPTKMPLMFHQIKLSIGKETIDHRESINLSPNTPWRFGFTVSITPEQVKQWLDSMLVLLINGVVCYMDRFGTTIEKPFAGELACTKSRSIFEYRGLPSATIEGMISEFISSKDERPEN